MDIYDICSTDHICQTEIVSVKFRMAKELCVTEQTIYRWEQGLSKPQIASKRKLMNLCKKKKIKIED